MGWIPEHVIREYDVALNLYCTVLLQHLRTVQIIKQSTHVTHVSHMCDRRGVNHTRLGFLGNTHMYIHTQYLHTRVHAHVVFTLACFYMCAYLYG